MLKKFKVVSVITTFFLVFLLSSLLTGCSKKKVEGFNPPMSDLTWGMTRKDYIDSLGDKPYEMIDLKDGVHSSIVLSDMISRFGNEAKVYLLFSIEMCADPTCGGRLKAVILRYDTAVKDDLVEAMKKELGDKYTEKNSLFNTNSMVWESEDLLKDIDKAHRDKIMQFLDSTGGATLLNSVSETDSSKKAQSETPVNAITLHEISENQASAFVVTYYGDWAYIDNVMHQESQIK